MTEINSDESLLRFIVNNKRAKSQPCVEQSTRKTRKCTAACFRTKKGDQCTGASDMAAVAAAAASLYCNDEVQKTCRPAQQHDSGSAYINNAAGCCRGQCLRTGKYAANDNQHCTGNRSYRANEGQCTVAAVKCVAPDILQCTGTRSYRATEGQCTGTEYYGANNTGCNGCGCVSAVTCLGGANAFGRGSTDTMVSTVCKWARVAIDWTWDKKSHFLVAAMSILFYVYTFDWWCSPCPCEEALLRDCKQ